MRAMMRNAKCDLLLLGAIFLSFNVMASDCDLTVSQTHTNFGTFSRGTLSQPVNGGQANIIGRKTAMLTIVCPRPEHITLYYRAAAGGTENTYLLGDIARLSLIISDAQADGKSVSLVYKQGGGVASSDNLKELPLLPDIGITPNSNDPVTTLVMQMTSVAAVNDSNVRIKEHKTLVSNGTLEVVSE
ncbi:hypothetical protein [Hafnia alvei]|nr:hypothetical protein [Hafnia alvei]TBL58722.1 hypothetical protein EYY92_17325 [Hafnia alvei]